MVKYHDINFINFEAFVDPKSRCFFKNVFGIFFPCDSKEIPMIFVIEGVMRVFFTYWNNQWEHGDSQGNIMGIWWEMLMNIKNGDWIWFSMGKSWEYTLWLLKHSNGQWPMIYEDLLLGNGHFPGCIAPLRAAIAADRSPASAPTA